MGELDHDEVLEAFAVVGEPEDIPKLMLARYGDVVDRISLLRAVPVRPRALEPDPRGLPRRRLTPAADFKDP